MSYRITVSAKAEKEMMRLPLQERKKLANKIDLLLSQDPPKASARVSRVRSYLHPMSERRKASVEGAAYFLTLTVLGWVDVFTRKVLADEIIKNLHYCQRNKGLRIFAYVIMSNHLHLVVQRDGGKVAEWLRDFKSVTAKRIIHLIETHPGESRSEWLLQYFREQGSQTSQSREFAFWKKDSHPTELYTQPVFDQKVEYIHRNPVVAGIVTEPEHYLLSSAHPHGSLELNGYDR